MGRKKKKFECELLIEDLQFPNKGIGYYEDQKVTVKNTIPNQKVKVRVSKKRKGLTGDVLEVVEKSPIEVTPLCEDFSVCGGCTYQHIDYDEEVKLKEKVVLDLFEKANVSYKNYLGIQKSPISAEYRNKMEYSFGDQEKEGPLALGMRKRRSFYEVVTSKHCNIVDGDYRNILNIVLDYFKNSEDTFYHKGTHEGTLRHLLVRKGYFTGEIVIALVTTSTLKTPLENLKNNLLNANMIGEIKGIYQVVNDGLADVVKIDEFKVLYGEEHFYDTLFDLKFKISPFSFFQTNTYGAEYLYKIVLDLLDDDQKTVFDLYCGTGTISQVVSKKAKKVIGIEIVEEAVVKARENAKLNNITNVEFIAGDVLKEVDNLKDKPDTIIIDPPRDGIHPKAINKIINFDAKKIIYVSCKPTSLVRDLKVFEEAGYSVEKLQLQDMFPRTAHIETVCLITKK